jgi:hypothetical protein
MWDDYQQICAEREAQRGSDETDEDDDDDIWL